MEKEEEQVNENFKEVSQEDDKDYLRDAKKYYFDTHIWLDFLENRGRNSEVAFELFKKIIEEDSKIILSEPIKDELISYGISKEDLRSFIILLKDNLVFTCFDKTQFGKSKDISIKRNIPRLDVLHAILARGNGAIFVTRDKHFDKLLDIIKYKRPEEIIFT